MISPPMVGPSWKSVYGLSVAPDGRLVFTVFDGQLGHVAFADPDGSRPRVIAPGAGYLYMAALSPAGISLSARVRPPGTACSHPVGG